MSESSIETTSSKLVEDVLLSHDFDSTSISAMDEPHLLFFLPLVLSVIRKAEEPSLLLETLRRRICVSRKLKLRFILLAKHPAFSWLPTKLFYSSKAYGLNSVIGRVIPPSCSGYLDELTPRCRVKIPVDMVDLQSEDFFRIAVFQPPSRENEKLAMELLTHPFSSNELSVRSFSDEISVSSRELVEDYVYEDDTFQTARLQTTAGQRVVVLLRLKLEAEEVNDSNFEVLLPRLIVRENQDVLKMQATQMLFYFLNHIWARTSAKYEDTESAPLCISFDAVATEARKGLLQTFNQVQSFETFNFDFWRDTKGHDPVAVDHFIRSAAGAYTAGYIIGVDYKNGSEICVKDEEAVFLRDTEGLFENTGPRIYIPKHMRECFRALRVWDEFRLCCIRAFDVARASHAEVFPLVASLYDECGVTEVQISQFIQGKGSLNIGQKDGPQADAEFRRWLG